MTAIPCAQCGLEVAPRLLACPGCGWLVHGEKLKALAQAAENAMAAGDTAGSLGFWRETLELLPADSRQAQAIAEKIEGASRRLELESPAPPSKEGSWLGKGGLLGAAALLLWKFKSLLLVVLSKGKLLLMGLTKSSTLFTMLASAGLYWTLWGWKFAFGLVLAIYVHEMGHVYALQRLGIRATAPMFIPGLGALVRLQQYPASGREDARVGLAGPLWGMAAAIGCWLVYLGTGWTALGAIAKFSAWINLFNLLPIPPLDGGRGYRALAQRERWVLAALIGGLFWYSGEGLLVLILMVALFRAFSGPMPEESDRRAFWEFALLLVVLTLLTRLSLPDLAA